jgi:hypothetical protein
MSNQDRIRQWIAAGKKRRASHVIVAYNRREEDFRPVYVGSNQNVRTRLSDVNNDHALQPVEVYNLSLDTETQLMQARTWNV